MESPEPKEPRERAPGLWIAAGLLFAGAWVAVLAALTQVPSGVPGAPRTIEDDLRAFYGEDYGEDYGEVIVLAVERRGFDPGDLGRPSRLTPEPEMREKLARIVEFGNSTPDPNDPHRWLVDKARRSFDPDPLSSEGIKEAVRKWASPWGVPKSEISLPVIHRIVEEHRAELRELLPEYTASYVEFRKRMASTESAAYLSPHFHDPRLIERYAPNNNMVNGGDGSGWRYLLLFDETSDPIHGPIYRRIKQARDSRGALIQQYFSHLKYGPDVSPWPPE